MIQHRFRTARVFLFLQGPHGPFFDQLAAQLRRSGSVTWRVGFNAGDSAFWGDKSSYIAYRESPDEWPARFESLQQQHQITDLVLYGDQRPIHAKAIAIARQRGLRIHIFEEGYLRPYWITYERDGSNGNSELMDLSIPQIKARVAESELDAPVPPGHWGDMHHHVFYGALYHWFVLFWNRQYPEFQPHRNIPVAREFKIHLKRMLAMPVHFIAHKIATHQIRRGSFPYHLVLLQLEHDSAFQAYSLFDTQADFLAHVIQGFATGAPAHHHLVIKTHPLEDSRSPIWWTSRKLARKAGIEKRVRFVGGGKLARLLDDARSAVTVNSTSGQQALWRGIPLRAFGAAIYDKPELVSRQPVAEFFATPARPDTQAYRIFRDFLLATSQIPGSFYAQKGRRQVLRHVTDLMLKPDAPYARPLPMPVWQNEAVRQQVHLVK